MTTNKAGKNSNIFNFEDSRLRQLEERLYRAQRARDNYLQNVQPNIGSGFGNNAISSLLELNEFNNKSASFRSKSADVRRRKKSDAKDKSSNIYSVHRLDNYPIQLCTIQPKLALHPTSSTWLMMAKSDVQNGDHSPFLEHFQDHATTLPFYNTAQHPTSYSTSHSNSDILLDSDMPAMDSKLEEIRQSLDSLRNFRLNMPSKDYFHSIYPLNQLSQQKQSTSNKFQPPNRTFEASSRAETPGAQRRIVFEALPEKSTSIAPAASNLSLQQDVRTTEETVAHYEVSSSSSSDTEPSLGINRLKTAEANVTKSVMGTPKSAGVDSKSPAAASETLSAGRFASVSNIPVANKPLFGTQSKLGNKESDSDSDFFH
uniref:Uncharacterized protein n=1 Tax=Ditylenchus dipsaci TaxID=166011 RepID=A0A915CZQ1_9BILA